MKRALHGAILVVALFVAGMRAVNAEPAVAVRRPANPLFAFATHAPDHVLRELGYSPIQHLVTTVDLDNEPAYPADAKDTIRKREGPDAVLWVLVKGSRDTRQDGQAVAVIRDLAAVAAENGVRTAIYPHAGNYLATAREALRVVKHVDQPNVGLVLALFHELAADQEDDLPQIIEEVAPHLFVVTISGTDRKARGQPAEFARMIRPLGQGDFDVYGVLERLEAVGFTGPVGLLCHGLKGDPEVHLRESMSTWKSIPRGSPRNMSRAHHTAQS